MVPQSSTLTSVPQSSTITFDLSAMSATTCIPKLTAGIDHRLVVIVADRPFSPPNLLTNDPEHRYNVTASGTSLTMAGWSVTCP